MKTLVKRGDVAVRSMIRSMAVTAALGLATLVPGSAGAVSATLQPIPDMVLVIEGIQGGSTLLKDAIDITGFTHSMNVEIGADVGTGLHASTPQLSPITITKHYDKSSVLLMAACAQGKRIPSATIYVRSHDDGKEQLLAITLEDVMISNIDLRAGHNMYEEAADAVTNSAGFGDGSVTLQYGKITEKVLGDGDPVSFSYDLQKAIAGLE